MKKVRILHTADLHIGAELSYLGENAESRKYEVLGTFKKITDLCKKEGVELCLIAGDLFDSNSAAKAFIKPVLDYIKDTSPTRFFLVCGNHDPLDASSPFLNNILPENLTVFGPEYETYELSDLGVRIAGRSFSHSSMETKEFPRFAEDGLINILVLHSDFGGSDSYNPINTAFVSMTAADYIALGHIHKASPVEQIGSAFLAYPGTPEGQGFDENGKKGVYLGTLSKGEHELKLIRTAKRLHITEAVDLSGAYSAQSAKDIVLKLLEDKYGETYQNNLYKLVLAGSPEDLKNINISELLSLLKEHLYFVKVKNNMCEKTDLELLSKEVSLKGIFVKNMLKKLAESENPEAVTRALYLGLSAFDTEVAYSED